MAANRLRTNFALNVIGTVLPIAIALVSVPIYISHIGAARYGVLSIVWLILGYFGFLDFGLSRAAANALAKLAHASREVRVSVLLTSLYFNLFLGAIGALVLYFVGGMLLGHLVNLSESVGPELTTAFPWIACMLPLALLAGVSRGALQSREHFFVLNVLDLIGFTFGQLIPIFFIIRFGPSLAIVIPAAFLARALSVSLNLGWVAKLERVNTILVFDRSRFRELFGFGAWVTVTNVIGPLLASIDQLLVGSILGATAVAHYTVPMNLVSRTQVLSQSLSSALFPRFSRLSREQSMMLAKKAVLPLGYGFGAICGLAIILGSPFLTVWLGTDFAARAALVLKLLLIGAWFNGIAYIPYSFLQGQGRPDLVAKVHAFEFLPYIAMLWFFLHRFGLPGAALAWSSRVVVDAAVLFAISHFPSNHLLRLAPALILIVASYLVATLTDVSLLASIAFSGLMLIAFVCCAYAFDATAEQIILALRARFLAG